MTPIALTIPLRLVSEANAHEHWRSRQKRAKVQRHSAMIHVRAALLAQLASLKLDIHLMAADRYLVSITRVAPRTLDTDNNVGSAKHCRDGIADALGIDDRSPSIDWRYGQRKPEAGEPKYGVDVRIESLSGATTSEVIYASPQPKCLSSIKRA